MKSKRVTDPFEIDRPNRNPIFAVKKIKVGPKVVRIEDRGEFTCIAFQRGIQSPGNPDLTITVEKKFFVKAEKRCNLGHVHSEEVTEKRDWAWIHLTWEEAQVLFEWFQQGTWSEIRDARTRQRAGVSA